MSEPLGTPNINEGFVPPTTGFGRIFESMYQGSMVGAGCGVFSVWPYAITHMRGHPEHGALVELNPVLLAFVLGTTQEEVAKAIEYLCAPDERSRNEKEEGRRLVRLGQFLYRVVNGQEYLSVRMAEVKRMKHNQAQARYEAKKKGGKRTRGKTSRERAFEEAEKNGDKRGMDLATGTAGADPWEGVPDGRQDGASGPVSGEPDIRPGP